MTEPESYTELLAELDDSALVSIVSGAIYDSSLSVEEDSSLPPEHRCIHCVSSICTAIEINGLNSLTAGDCDHSLFCESLEKFGFVGLANSCRQFLRMTDCVEADSKETAPITQKEAIRFETEFEKQRPKITSAIANHIRTGQEAFHGLYSAMKLQHEYLDLYAPGVVENVYRDTDWETLRKEAEEEYRRTKR